MAICTLTFTSNTAAISEAVKFIPDLNQVIAGVAIDADPVTAEASANTYTAKLIQKASYMISAPKFEWHLERFTCPASSSATLTSLIEFFRKG